MLRGTLYNKHKKAYCVIIGWEKENTTPAFEIGLRRGVLVLDTESSLDTERRTNHKPRAAPTDQGAVSLRQAVKTKPSDAPGEAKKKGSGEGKGPEEIGRRKKARSHLSYISINTPSFSKMHAGFHRSRSLVLAVVAVNIRKQSEMYATASFVLFFAFLARFR